MNCERPLSTVRVSVAVRVPSALANAAVTVAAAVPRFCMTIVVVQPSFAFPAYGRATLLPPGRLRGPRSGQRRERDDRGDHREGQAPHDALSVPVARQRSEGPSTRAF